MAHFRLYHPSDAGEVVSLNLRQADIDELYAATGMSPELVLEDSLLASEVTWVIVDDKGDIAGVFGVVKHDMGGIPWLLLTNSIDTFKRKFLRQSIQVVKDMQERFDGYLFNIVDSRHKEAIRWLEWLGFTIEYSKPITGLYEPEVVFYRFYKEAVKDNV